LLPEIHPEVPENFRDIVRSTLERSQMQPLPSFIEKTRQLYESLLLHRAVILAGPSGSGKTSLVQTLMNTIPSLKEDRSSNAGSTRVSLLPDVIRTYTVNPSVLSTEELFGRFDQERNRWMHGLLGKLLHKIIKVHNNCGVYFVS
jgi:MoxR-like ATPase